MKRKQASAEALITAVSNGQIAEAEKLLATGIDVNEKVDGMTALHFVIASRTSFPGFKWLLEKSASLDERDKNGLTPLMTVCARSGRKATEMALALIEA